MTADELALLRGVEASPDDDLPRLVYADWLDEHGRHARAEFIRVQCELASIERRLPEMTVEERRVAGPRRGELLRAEGEMFDHRLAESLGFTPHYYSGRFRYSNPARIWRGFVEEYRSSPFGQKYQAAISGYAAIIPRPKIVLVGLVQILRDDARHSEFVDGDIWSEIDEVHLTYSEAPTEPILPHQLIPMTLADYPRLDSFTAENAGLNPGHVCVIAERLRAPNLVQIDLSANEIVDSGVAFLHRAVYAKNLRSIDLSRNPICRPEISKLTKDRFPSLQRVNLTGCPIMPQSLAQLRAQLPGVEVIC